MPTRNAIKQYAPDSYYHIYSRGINKQKVFLDDEDYAFFLSLLKRYLSSEPEKRPNRQTFLNLHSEIELLSFCLMPNHIHMLMHQNSDERALQTLMHAVMTSYSMYFNKKYSRRGPVFESRYLASLIDNDAYLMHISRYVHLNPTDWQHWEYSSIHYYIGSKHATWMRPSRILGLFGNNSDKYLEFVGDYEDQKQILDELKHELANE